MNGSAAWGATQIVRITADGVVSPYASIPNRGQLPDGIADWQMLPNGTTWLAEADTNYLAHIDANGSATEHHAVIAQNSARDHLVDAKGNVWADDTFYGRVIRLARDGELHEYSFPMPELACWKRDDCTEPYPLAQLQTRGADAVLLVRPSSSREALVRYVVAPSGSVTREKSNGCFVAELNFICGRNVPKLSSVAAAYAIIGPDKALWFSDPEHSRIGAQTDTAALSTIREV